MYYYHSHSYGIITPFSQRSNSRNKEIKYVITGYKALNWDSRSGPPALSTIQTASRWPHSCLHVCNYGIATWIRAGHAAQGLVPSSQKKKTTWFVVFVNFCNVTSPSVANFKLPVCCPWTKGDPGRRCAEPHIICCFHRVDVIQVNQL